MTWWVISVLRLSRGQSKDGTLWKSAGVYKLVAVFGEKVAWHGCRKFTCASLTGGRFLYYRAGGL